MSDFPVEKKLEMVQQIRSQHYRNQSDMMNREQILYGRTWVKRPENDRYYGAPQSLQTEYTGAKSDNAEEGIFKDNTLKIRYALAAALFMMVVLFDHGDQTIAGISMNQVFAAIETDYEETIDAWVAEIQQR